MCLGLERRVLTFPSGVLGELDLNLFVDVGLGGGLRLPVCRREDAEGDRNASFKVQVGDLCTAQRGSLLLGLPTLKTKGGQEDPSCFFSEKEVERKGREKAVCGWTRLLELGFQSNSYEGKEMGLGDLWLSVSGRRLQFQDEEEKIRTRTGSTHLHERGRFKYASGGALPAFSLVGREPLIRTAA
ncbi:hypothetical protein VTK56DRAFT_3508 [Thermocarpiscus australiensis]